MEQRRFDPGHFFEFDLSRGEVRARSGARVLLLSDNVVSPLVSAAIKGGDLAALRNLGAHFGEEAKRSLGGDARQKSPEQVLEHASAVVSLFGFGRLSLVRWADALVAHLEDLPTLDEDDLGVAALLGGLFSALVSREVACVPVGEGGDFLVVDPSIAEQVTRWAKGGVELSAIVGRMTPATSLGGAGEEAEA